jgi:hypothetical protein
MYDIIKEYSNYIYYTDTDSFYLSIPLKDELVSSTQLGKFKLEYKFLQVKQAHLHFS